ncbi:MAG TPA: bacillithiol biosynthesis BshC [Gemmatimonadaceae bacterium]|nr:bacillithiol biosynthesis BshC [Gemmatimonadaceae bacterium]
MSEPRVLSLPLAMPNVARAARNGGPESAWYEPAPRDASEWRTRATALRSDGRWADTLAPALQASGAAADRLARAADGGVVVTTGQQPGLFGGPIYTWSKALSAIALADAIEDVSGIPTCPVYWAATYDSDYAEASVTYVAVDDRVVTLTAPPPAVTGRGMRETPLGDVGEGARTLAAAAGAAAAPHVMDDVRRAYSAHTTVGDAFVALLRSVLEPLGMPVLDAGHPAMQTLVRPVLARALAEAPKVDAALRERNAALVNAGYEPQVALVDRLSLVFATVEGERRRLPIGARLDDAPGSLEPNVLLRPVVGRAMLPTVAYVAGPAEQAYFAQSTAVADALGMARPLAVPRWSGVIVEPHVQRVLDRYGLDVDALRDPHAALGRLVRERVPADVGAAAAHYRQVLEAAAAELEAAVARTTPPLVDRAVAEGTRRNIAHRLDRLERRIAAATKRRQTDLVRQIGIARASLFPLDRLQERVLNLMPLLARHGLPLLDAMAARAREHVAALGLSPAGQAAGSPHAGGGR